MGKKAASMPHFGVKGIFTVEVLYAYIGVVCSGFRPQLGSDPHILKQ